MIQLSLSSTVCLTDKQELLFFLSLFVPLLELLFCAVFVLCSLPTYLSVFSIATSIRMILVSAVNSAVCSVLPRQLQGLCLS